MDWDTVQSLSCSVLINLFYAHDFSSTNPSTPCHPKHPVFGHSGGWGGALAWLPQPPPASECLCPLYMYPALRLTHTC